MEDRRRATRAWMGACAIAVASAAGAGCLRTSAYHCAGDGDCVRGGTQGTCEGNGFCAFPDPGCPSGNRFDPSAGDSAGACVGAAAIDGGVDAPMIVCATDRIPACHPGGGDATPCEPIALSAVSQSFTLGMTVVGDYVLYAGGDGDVHRLRYDGLADTSIDGAGQDSVGLASDGVNVYWGDYYDAKIRAAPLTSPFTPYDVTTLPSTPSFGRLAVGGGMVFVNGTDGVWMAKTDGSQPTATKVASKIDAGNEDKSSGIAVDATHVYWSDDGKIKRIPIAQAGNATAIQDVAIAAGADNVALDADRVYWTSTLGVSWRNKDLSGLTTIPVGDTMARGLVLDGDFVYTDTPDGRILRVKKGGAAADVTVVAQGVVNPYELAVDCGAIYWGTFVFGNYGTVYKVRKP